MFARARAIAATLMIVSALGAIYVAWLLDPAFLPPSMSSFLFRNFGERPYAAPVATAKLPKLQPEAVCPPGNSEWRDAQTVDGVDIKASLLCEPDNPYEVAAFVKGTNNVSMATLMETQLTPDAVVKGRDLDGDGDPDEIHIRLEVAELNGHSPDAKIEVPGYSIAPGVKPGFWAFVPKARGMATRNLETFEAQPMLRMPSPSIRVEQGDKVKITLENTHYLPHTIHLHGVDHPFKDANGEGNDGVPLISEMPIFPGEQRTYDIQPRQDGSMFYHCHVQPQSHVLMGLNGLFVVEPNRPNNWVQTLNVGAGQVRHPSVAVQERNSQEYDMHYLAIDYEMHNILKTSNDPRVVSKRLHRDYNITKRKPEAFLLNGRSFPYTIRESLVIVKPDERVKMRILNGGADPIYLHTHGHKVTETHYDGIERPEAARITRDVVHVGPAQRVDVELQTVNDGLHSYGPGAWLMHDHREEGVTTNGIGPGGNISLIVYEEYLGENGIPKIPGNLSTLFTEEYWRGEIPVFADMDPKGLLSEPVPTASTLTTTFLTALLVALLGLFFGSLLWLIRSGGAASAAAKK